MNTEYYKLYNIDYYGEYKKYISFLSDINEDSFNLYEMLPDHSLDRFKEHTLNKENNLKSLDSNLKYLDLFENHTFLFNNLVEAEIDLLIYKAFLEIEKNPSILSNIKSFKPKNKKTNKVVYERCGNVTGRLVVKKGPKILTIPSRYRSILKSSHDKGNIYSIDFSSLEPRITAKLSGNNTKNDIYEEVLNLLSFNADRSIIKKAVISSIYGANYSSLEGLSIERSKEIFNKINEYFDFDKILELSKNVDDTGIRRNFYGRPLWNLSETRENVLINNYIQSSAVDVSLTYFTELVRSNCDFKPLFVLHDALIIDLSDENYIQFKEIVEKGYNDSKLGYFPLKLEKFNI